MDLACRPLNRPIGMEVGNEGVAVPALKRPGHQADLYGRIRHARGRARRLEVDGGEEALVKKFQVASVQFSVDK